MSDQLRSVSAQPRGVPPVVLVVAAVLSVQFGNAAAASFFESLGPLGAVALRLFCSAAILLLIVHPNVGKWTGRTWLGAALLGLGLGGMNTLIYLAINEIPLGIAVTIELLGPLAVAAIGTRRLRDVIWVLLALAGVLLLGFDGDQAVNLLGVLFAAAAACCWALYIVASSRLGPRVQGLDGLAVAMVFAAAVAVPFGAPDAIRAVSLDPMLLLVFAGVALLTSVIPYALEFTALRRISSRVFGVLSSLGPAAAALAGLLVLGQMLSLMQVAAIALVVAASIGVVASSRRA